MATLYIKQGDGGYYLLFTVTDSAGTAYNLTGYTIALKVWPCGSPSSTAILTGSCAIVVAASGTCRYALTTTDLVTKGEYDAELELTQSGVKESTETFQIIVSDSPLA